MNRMPNSAEMLDVRCINVGSVAAVSPPLVSIVINNYNYARYIDACIDSVKAQDYPNLEVAIVDNASTDNSLGVIAEHTSGDPRFKVIPSPTNDGPLGAFIKGLDATSGAFICSVDSDDYMFPTFISTHVQTHLAVPHPVSYTESGVVEVDATGAILTGGRGHEARLRRGDKKGLLFSDIAPRLPCFISDQTYNSLSETVVSLSPANPYTWYSGSVPMYRRSTLSLIRPNSDSQLLKIGADGYFMSIDGYCKRLCHDIGGSARIEKPLSAYRIHGANNASQQVRTLGVLHQTGPANKWNARRQWHIRKRFIEITAEYLSDHPAWHRKYITFRWIWKRLGWANTLLIYTRAYGLTSPFILAACIAAPLARKFVLGLGGRL